MPKLAGFPLWVWGVAGAGAIAVGLLLLKPSSSSSSADTADTSQLQSLFESTPLIYVMIPPYPAPLPPPPATSPPAEPPTMPPPPDHHRFVGPPVRLDPRELYGAAA